MNKKIILTICLIVLVVATSIFTYKGIEYLSQKQDELFLKDDEILHPDLDESDESGIIFDEWYYDNSEEKLAKHCELVFKVPQLINEDNFNAQVAQEINNFFDAQGNTLQDIVTEVQNRCYQEVSEDPAMQDAIARGENRSYYHEISYEVVYEFDNLVSVRLYYSYYTGGAHPNSVSTHINYEVDSDSLYTLTDEIDEDEFVEFVETVYSQLRIDYADSLYPEVESKFNVTKIEAEEFVNMYSKSWSWNDSGYQFFFDPYEVAPYAGGPVEIVVSW